MEYKIFLQLQIFYILMFKITMRVIVGFYIVSRKTIYILVKILYVIHCFKPNFQRRLYSGQA